VVMHRRALSWGLLLAFALSGCQRSSSTAAPDRGLTEGTLVNEAREVKRLYDAATLHSNGDWFQRTFAEDYVWYGPDGEVVTKEEYIRDLVSRDLVWDSVAVKDMKVRVYGETAIATGRFFGKGRFKGTPLDERQRFTSVLIKRNGSWLIASEHCSKLAPADQ
jgi:ketosteroid isomerase-like protein